MATSNQNSRNTSDIDAQVTAGALANSDTQNAESHTAVAAAEAPTLQAVPTLTIDPFAGDNILTRSESITVQALSGTTTGVEAGKTVNITLGDWVYAYATVQEDGRWKVDVENWQMSNLMQFNAGSEQPLSAAVINEAGEVAESTVQVAIEPDWPSLVLNALAGDNVISGPEGGVMQVVSGATNGVEAGQVVTITINGISYSAEVLADGTWRAEVPAADVAALPDGAQILATVSNAAGQQAGDSAVLIVDNTLPSLTFNTFVGDNVLSDAEATRTQTLTGITSGIESGQTVTVKLNGYTYTTQIGEDGAFSVSVPPAELLKLSNGQVEITASATNQAGQVTNSSGHMTVAFTTERIIVDGVAGDNYINKEESGNGFDIIGSAPSLPANTPITITIGTKNFGTRVEADGSWRTMLDIDDIRSFPDGQYTMTFSAPGSASTSVDVGIYVQAWEKLHIDVEEPFGDGVLTAGEAEEGQVITGTTSGPNLQVRVYVDTSQFTTTSDSEGRWSITVPAEVLLGMMAIPDQTSGYIHAEVTDIAGNSQSNGRNFEIAAQDIGLTLNPVAQDNRINAVEAAAGITISGSADTTAAGLTVTLKIGGLERTTTIQADGSWLVPLSTSELVSLPEGYVEVSVSVPGSTPVSQSVEVAIQSNPIPTLATPFEDGTLGADESASDQTLSGTTGVSGEDQNVVVTFAGKEYLATVDNQGNWQVTLPAVDLQAVPAGAAALSIVATDDAGNSGVLNTTVQVEPPQGAITIDPVTGDNLVSYAEAVAGITLTGSTRGLAEGSTLTLSIADETYSVTTDAEGRWSLPLVEGQVIGVWNDPIVLLTVSAPEADGPATTQEIENYTNRRPEPTVEAPFGNSVLSVAEAATDQTLVGSTGLSGANQQVVITLGGSDYTGQVDEGGRWQVTLAAAALQALEEGTQALAITATNAAGESKTLSVNVEVALTPPTLTLEPVAGDDVITFAEAEAEEGILLTGHTSVSQGSIALTLGDQSWITETDSQGNWSQLIPAHTFSYPEGAFPDGNYALVATLTDANGNSTTVSRPVSLQADAGTLPAVSVTSGLDSVLNGAERQVAQAISGTTRHVEAGQAVTLSVNEQSYSAEVLADGSWSLIIPAADIAALPAGSNILQVAVADRAGNPAETELVRFAIEESLGGIALDTVAGDNRINAYEAGSNLLVQGVATNVAEGTAVTLALGGRSYQAEVQADGRWQVTVPAADVQALGDGVTTAQVTTTDQNGDPLADSLSLTLLTHAAPLATLDPPFGDGYLNIGEAATPQVLSGTTGNTGVGQSVSLSLAGHTLRGTVDEAGRWSVPVPVEILQQLPAETLLIAVEATDAAGNVSSVLEYATAVLTAPTVTINALTGDNLLDAAELGVPLAIAGTTSGVADGQVLTLTIGTLALTTEVTGGGLWQVIVPVEQLGQLANGSSTVTASVADVAGNEATASQIVTLNNTLDGIAFDLIAGDNRIDAQEAANGFNIGGLVSGVAPGTQVTLTLGDYSDLTYTNEDGSWGLWIPGNLIRTQGLLTATVETVDADGNPLSASVDLFSSANALPQVTINPLPYVNIEATQTGITLTGETHFSGAGQSLTLTLAGQEYSAQVEDNGTWSVFLPPEALQVLSDGSAPFSVVVTDSGGNQSQASAALEVDVTAPQLTLEPVTGDNVLNQGELQQDLVLAGTSDEPYGWISASFNGHTYTGTSDENGLWSIIIPAASLNGLAPGTQILNVTLSDQFGNPTTLQQEVEIASNDLPLLTILPFTGDNQLLGAERSVAQMLTGTTTHVEAGQIVTVTLNGETYSATVQSDGQWSLIVPQEDLAELVNIASGQVDLVASVSNQAGDTVTDLVSLAIVTNRPSLAFDLIAGDNRLNASEAGGDLVVVGKVFGVPAENPITVTLNGQTYIATVEGSDWSITLPAADLAALPDGAIVITAEAEDTFFNLISSTLTLTVAIHDLPEVGYDTPFGDGVLSAAEAADDQLLTGQTGQTGIAQTVTVTLGGETFTGEVDAAGLWRVTLPAEALQALPAGPASYTVTVTDVAGNSDSQEVAFTAAASAPLLQIDPLTGDNLIDQTEALGEIVVTGSVTDLNALPGATLTITLAGVTYPATLDESGAWSATLPFGALLDFQDGDYTLSATLIDGAGNVSEASQTFTLDLYTQPYLGINVFAGDNILNGAEQQIDQLVDGTAYGVEAGQIVTLTLNGQSYSATVGQGGSWSTTIPAADLAALTQGGYSLLGTVSDAAGNSSEFERYIYVDLNVGAVAIDPLAGGDDRLNLAEASEGLTVTGTSSYLSYEENGYIAVTLGGKEYTTWIEESGNWSVTIPAADLLALQDGNYGVVVSAQDDAGNPISFERSLDVYVHNLPSPTLETPFGDGVLDSGEAQQAQILTGATGLSATGQSVVVELAGVEYDAEVDGFGTWTLTLPPAVLQALPAGESTLTVTARDVAGNSRSQAYTIDVESGSSFTIDPVTEDNRLNSDELSDLTLSGHTAASWSGATVVVAISWSPERTYSGTVNEDGSWSVVVPGDDLFYAGDNGVYSVEAVVTAEDGATLTASHDFIVNIRAFSGGFAFDDLTEGVLSPEEQLQDQYLSGTFFSEESVVGGRAVTITMTDSNGLRFTYTTTTDEDGTWNVILPSSDLQQLSEGAVQLNGSVSDGAGNTISNEDEFVVTPESGSFTIDTIAGDNVLTIDEVSGGLVVSGGSAYMPTLLTADVEINGIVHSVYDYSPNWSVTFTPQELAQLPDGPVTVTVSGYDLLGNLVTATTELTVELGDLLPLEFDVFSGDNIVEEYEVANDQQLSGRVNGVAAGSIVNLTLADFSYSAEVQEDGSWSTTIPAADLQTLPTSFDNAFTGTVTDADGNLLAIGSLDVIIYRDAGALSIDPLAGGDNLLTADEINDEMLISGYSNHAEPESDVVVELNGRTYVTSVGSDGYWSLAVPPDDLAQLANGDYTVTASGTDVGGNPITASSQLTVSRGLVPTLEMPFGDGVLDSDEAAQGQTLVGSTGLVADGQSVVVSLAGIDYDVQVDGQGNWQLALSAEALQALPEGENSLTVTAFDAEGNSVGVDRAFNVIPTGLILNPITDDNVLTSDEAVQDFTVSGHAAVSWAGAAVAVTFSFTSELSYSGTVDDEGNWSITVPAGELYYTAANGLYTVEAVLTQEDGSTASASREFTMNTLPFVGDFVLDLFTGDDALSYEERSQDQVLSGTYYAEEGTSGDLAVTVTLRNDSGQIFSYDTRTDGSGNFSVTVLAADMLQLDGSGLEISAAARDGAGNTVEGSRPLYLSVLPQTGGSITFDPIAGDNILTADEVAGGLVISGDSAYLFDRVGAVIEVQLNGVSEYTTVDLSTGSQWSVTFSSDVLAQLPDGPLTITASTYDVGGNAVTSTSTLEVDLHDLPAPTLATPFGDGVLDSGEAAQEQTLTGTTGVAEEGQRVVVSLAGEEYEGEVDSDGNWRVALPADALQALAEGSTPLTVTATNANGVSVSLESSFDVNPTGLTIDPVTEDNTVYYSESDEGFAVSGHAALGWAGAAVTVTFSFETERSYSGTVDAEGNWRVEIPGGNLNTSSDNGTHSVEVVLTQEDGATASASHDFTMNTRPLVGDIVLDLFTGDNTLTYDEQTQDQVLTGTYFAEEGPNANLLARVTLQDSGGHIFTYETRTDDNGHFSVTVPAADMLLIYGDWIGFSASVIDGAGNTVNGSVPLDVAVLPQGGGSITFDPVAGDNILTADEVAGGLVVSGDSDYLYDPRNGNQITVELNGLTKYFYIDSNSGSQWSVSFSPEELALLPDGSLTITASSTDLSGSSVIATTLLEVDLYSLPSPTLDTPFGDNVLDYLEAQQDQQLTGTTNQSGEGQSVTLELAGQIFSATVDENGAWSVLIPAGALAGTENGNYPLTVTVNGPQGDTSLTQEVTLASGITLTLDTPFGDNVLDSAEAQLPQTITGTTTLLEEGAIVDVSIGNYLFEGFVDAAGNWSVTVPAGRLAELPNGTYTLDIRLYDTTGHGVATLNQPVELATIDAALIFDDFAGDNIVDGTEQFSDQTLSGEALGVPVGSLVTLTLGDLSYSTEVQADGRWSVLITADDLAQLPDDTESLIGGQITDADGNVLAGNELAIFINRGLGTLSLDPLADDSILTADEAADGLIVSGTITLWMVDTPVTVEFNGNTYQTTVTASNGSWQLTIPAEDLLGLTDGNYTLTASAEDAEGNALSASAPLAVDLNLQPELVFDLFAGDDILGADEADIDQQLSGHAYGVPAGSVVTITLGDLLSYTTEVQVDQSWSVTIPAGALSDLPNQSDAAFYGEVTDADGNVLASADHLFYVDDNYGSLSLDPLAGGDYILSAAEAAEGLIISGTITRWEFDTPVYVELNGTTYQTTVTASNGSWQIYIAPEDLLALPDGDYTVNVTAQDASGNELAVTAPLAVDIISEPQPTLNTPFEDGILNAQETQLDQVLTGNTGLSGEGQSVRVVVNGISFTGTVDETGVWSVTLPSALLAGLPQGENTLEITATDANGTSTTLASTLVVDTTGPEVALGTVAGDNIANAAEMAAGVVVSGTSSEVGGLITLQLLEGVSYETEVQEDGSWELTLPAGLLTHLRDGDYTLTVSQTDAEGNTTTVTETLRLDGDPRDLPTIKIDRIGGDNVLNGAEVQSDQIITGTVKNVEAGQPVTVTLGDHTYTGVVLSGGSWAVSVPAADLLALGNGRETLTASVTARSGNPAEADRDFTIKGKCPGLSIDPVTGDNLINASEADGAIVLSGETYGVRSGATVQLKLNGHRYSATVQKDGSWSTEIPASEAARLRDGELKLTANVKNRHGDRLSDSLILDVHTRDLPDLSLETPFGDGTLNLADARTAQRLTGETGVRGEGQLVTLTLNGVDYSADVNNRGQWSVTLPAAALRALPEGELEVRVVAKDAAGNSAETTRTVLVDFTPPVLSLAPLPAIGLSEQSASFTLSGTATAAAAGLVVLILLNGESYQAEVQEDGSWSTEIPSGALPAVEASWPLAISLTDEAGNTTDLTSSVTLRTEGDTATAETAAEGGDTAVESTLTAALASDTGSLTQDRAEANSEESFTIGGVTLDLSKAGDEAQGGDGDDTIALYTLDFAHIDGGAGIDTLLLAGEDQHLDLVALGLKVEHIDIFDLGRTGSNSLTLNLDEALNVKDQPADSLLVKGAEGSQLNLAGDGSTWAESGQRQLDGLTFDIYHNSALESDNTLGDVLVQHGIVVQQV
ncbi:hypothetical protein C1N62_05205 [Nissabacter sp. SGAir0207]|nr:Ig-like domain-containing protein [Nissabacter sp. SGAir0207]QCR35526.1 hypothetical protein C1N62_05205 [Nissabacter sp. SGAir0207]